MKMKISAFAAAICGMCSLGVNAGQLTVPVTAEATVNNACSTTTSALDFNFGTVRSGNFSNTRTISAPVVVSCTGNTPYKFSTAASSSNSQFTVGKVTPGTPGTPSTTTTTNGQVPQDCHPELGASGVGTGNIVIGRDGVACTVTTTTPGTPGTPSSYTARGVVSLAVDLSSSGSYTKLENMSAIVPTVDAQGNAVAKTTLIYARLSANGDAFTDQAAVFPNENDSYTQNPGTNLYINY